MRPMTIQIFWKPIIVKCVNTIEIIYIPITIIINSIIGNFINIFPNIVHEIVMSYSTTRVHDSNN